MADPVLATVQQLEARLGHTVDAIRATALLEDASAIVRGYTRQYFSRVLNDVVTLAVSGGKIVLPQRPADKPTVVARVDGTGPYPTSAWFWGGVGVVEFGTPSWVANGGSYVSSPPAAIVTYSHGYTTIPGDVVAIVCQMVGRVIDSGIASPGLDTESIDDYRAHMGAGLLSGSVALAPDEKLSLDRYRKRNGSVQLR